MYNYTETIENINVQTNNKQKNKNKKNNTPNIDSMISSIEQRENDEDADNESDISNDHHMSLELKKYHSRSSSKKKLQQRVVASSPTQSISSLSSTQYSPSNSPTPQSFQYPQYHQQQPQSPIPSLTSLRRKSYTPPTPSNMLFDNNNNSRISPTSHLNINPLYNSTGSLGSSTSTNNLLHIGEYNNSQYSSSPMAYRTTGALPPISTSPNNLINTPLKRSISNSSIMFTPNHQPFPNNNNNNNNNNNISSLYTQSISSGGSANSIGVSSSPLTFSTLASSPTSSLQIQISPSPPPHLQHLLHQQQQQKQLQKSNNVLGTNINSTPIRSKIKKAPSFCGYPQKSILMDYSFITTYGQDISSIIALELSSSNIKSVNNEKFELFDKLIYIDLNNNFVQFSPFSIIPNLCELYLSNNQIENLQFNSGFKCLTKLDLSNNLINSKSIHHLLKLEKLLCLNLSFNEIITLPEDMSSLQALETLYLESCHLSLKTSTLQSLSTIPNLRLLNLNNNQWDRILPIGGVFKSLIELSLCNNFISNLYSIGNLYHTSYPLLTRVQLYGNPLKSTLLSLQVNKSIQLITTQPSISPTSSTSSLSSNSSTPSKHDNQLFSTKKRSIPNKSQSTSSIDKNKLRDSDPIFFNSNYIKQQQQTNSPLSSPSSYHQHHHYSHQYYQQKQQILHQAPLNNEPNEFEVDEETYNTNNFNDDDETQDISDDNEFYYNHNSKELSLSDLTIN
ncbi:hypothetical protein DICPUDRAFT_80529 [Dictyostelium purpureum]|uniref:Leucine-rich repeat-containing protein n=1 Tax=Dictyostelium purpureum TaxID=5786 RepID=F0ZQR4_DICPU|nr:uncharacterized protein DICPUDRAFT_80529 [Dictyostelium purpureum]EGC33714.1 hypothetical protein DICPUDRAFT_80529 [Dictyostelium purpureum]|eukprot:XP_003289753.1 hypothetical protein DICPUDRAFT_80529 [Dictyostelium purpureum]